MAVTYLSETKWKNCRFEAFLQRMLPATEFLNVEAYSPCVVESSSEKLVFRHVVLTGEKIYLTEHPPRTVYGITTIADIVDIKTVTEQPSFLTGKYKETCQHVRINCRSHRPHKKSWNRRKSVSEQNLNLAVGLQLEKPIVEHQPLEQSNSDSMLKVHDLSSERSSGRSSRLSRIFNLDFLTNNRPNSPVSFSPPITSKTNSFFPESFTPTEAWSRSSSRTSNGRSSSQTSNGRSSSQASNGRSSTLSISSLPATSDLMFNQSHDSNDPRIKMEEINLYILNPISKFVNNLFLIWDTKLINYTLTSEDDTVSSNLPLQKNEKIEKLFKDLIEELLENEKNVEEFFNLLQELLSSLKKCHLLRTLFWKNPKLVQLLVTNLEEFLLCTDKEVKLETREDELEIALIILKILHLSFMEQDNSSLRQLHLTANGNKHINNIIQLALSLPKLPIQYLNTTQRMLNNYSEFSSKVWNNLPEAELIQQSAEITHKQVLIITEIIKHGILEIKTICQFIKNYADQFIARTVTQLLSLLTKEEYYKPNEVILLYKYLYLFQFVMSKSEKLKCKILSDYNEEFRYFVKCDLVLVKIINCCPLKRTVEKLMGDINNIV